CFRQKRSLGLRSAARSAAPASGSRVSRARRNRIFSPVCDRIVFMSRIALAALLVSVAAPLAAADFPAPTEGDYAVTDFQFTTGEKLPQLNLHYTTVGTPV